jgi:hypothetical protein
VHALTEDEMTKKWDSDYTILNIKQLFVVTTEGKIASKP